MRIAGDFQDFCAVFTLCDNLVKILSAVEEDIRHVNEKLERVKRKELTMMIVAPISAGKSTIINAIANR